MRSAETENGHLMRLSSRGEGKLELRSSRVMKLYDCCARELQARMMRSE